MFGTMTYLEATGELDVDDLCCEVIASVLHQVLLNVLSKVLTCFLEAV